MPLQEFLASYAVQVDEDGARRLQKILDQNRTSAGQLASVFENAYSALKKLKKELSDTAGMKNVLSVIQGNASASPRVSSALSGMSGGSSGSALAGVSAIAGKSVLSISANLNPAEEALSGFRSRLEAERPRLNVNATGITTAVSSAIAQIRTMMSSVRLTIPVTAKATLDSSGLKAGISGVTGSSGASGSGASAGSSSSGSSHSGSSGSLIRLGIGGRVSRPTLALIAEEGSPEYVIPTDNDARAVTLLRSLLSELSSSAKKAVLPWLEGEAGSAQEKAGKSAFATENELLKSSRLLPVTASKTTENDAVNSAADLSGFLSAISTMERNCAATEKTETALSEFLSNFSTVLRDQSATKEKTPSSRTGSLSRTPLSGSLEGDGKSQRSLQQILSEAMKESGRSQRNLPLMLQETLEEIGTSQRNLPRLLQEALEESGRSQKTLPLMLQETLEGIGTSQRNLPLMLQETLEGIVTSQRSLPQILSEALEESATSQRSLPRIPPEALEAIQNDLRSALPGISASALPLGSSLAGLTDSLSDMRALFSSLVSSARSIFLPSTGSSGPVSNSVQAPVNIHVTAAPGQAEAIGQRLYDVTERSLLKTLQGVFA